LVAADQARAQGTDVGASGVGLISFQPIDEAYVGGPYLSEAIGGIGPGFGAGVSAIFPNGIVIAAEYTTARYELEQEGRVVAGEGRVVTTRLHDSLLSGLVGYATTASSTRIQVLGGVSAKLDLPTIDGQELSLDDSLKDDPLPFALTGGADLLQRLSARASLVIGARYSYIGRHERLEYLGIGTHVLRAGVGVRVRIN
jgi:hypothetical protein